MTDKTIAANLSEKLFGASDSGAAQHNTRVQRVALQLLAAGDPITRSELAATADASETDLEHATAGQDIEYDDDGRIVGWGLTRNPTPHKFTVDGHQLYTWCAPDTLIFPAVIGSAAYVESP